MNKHLSFLIFFVALSSCKKNRDETYPSVQFSSPGFQSSHAVLEPIYFQVSASDETKLDKISVHLLDDSYLPVATSSVLICDENSETFNGSILPSDIHLPSGTYYLKAVATDGFNEKVAYREIYLNEVPRELKTIWILSYGGNQSIHLDSLQGNSLINVLNLNQDFGGFLVNSYQQMMMIAGSQTGQLTQLHAEYLNTQFQLPNTGSGTTTFFTYLWEKNDKTFISDRSGLIRSFRKTSTAIDVVDLGNYFAESFCVSNDFLISSSILSSGSQKSIQVYYLSSSTLYQSMITSMEVKKMFVLNSDEILMIGNESGIGKIKVYSLSGNNFSEPIVFTGGIIRDAAKINDENYLIAHSNGVDQIDLNSLNQANLINGLDHQLVRLDALSQVIFAAHGNILSTYTVSPLNLIQNVTATDSIAGLELLYNK